MEMLKSAAMLVSVGIKDFFYGVAAIRKISCQKKIPSKKRLYRSDSSDDEQNKNIFYIFKDCIGFGALFYLAIKMYEKLFLEYAIQFCEWQLGSDFDVAIHILYYVMLLILRIFLTMPLFIISRILNYEWYQEIADITFQSAGGKKRPSISFSLYISDQTNSILIQLFFLLQGYLILCFPVSFTATKLLSILHFSILYSLYAFEYKWLQVGMSLNSRLSTIEKKWPYYVGFGLPLALLTSCVSSYVESIILFSIFFPLYVFSSTVVSENEIQFNMKLPLFKLSKFFTEFLIKKIFPSIKVAS